VSKIATSTKPISVAIIDDHEAIRLGFAGACEIYNCKLVAQAASVDDLLKQLKKSPQVVVLDLSLADGSSAGENVRRLIEFGSKVLIYSIADRKSPIKDALTQGAAALVKKNQDLKELFQCIELVANGIEVNTAETLAAIDNDQEFKAKLTDRELEVLRKYASGMSLKQVAFELKLSPYTVKEHIDRVRVKYSDIGRPAPGKSELLMRLIEDGLMGEDLI
jgi:DNA-binding NarL/FixJ family response regulator